MRQFVDGDELLNIQVGDLRMLLLDVPKTVGLHGKPNLALGTNEWFLSAAAVGAQVMLECAEKLEVSATVLAHGIWGVEVLERGGEIRGVLVVGDCFLNLFLLHFFMLFPDMSFTVGLGGESIFAYETLKGTFPVMSSEMADQGALVRARVATQIALVRRQSHVNACMT